MAVKAKDPPETDESEKRKQQRTTTKSATATKRKMTVKAKVLPEQDNGETEKQLQNTATATKRKMAVKAKDPPEKDESQTRKRPRTTTITTTATTATMRKMTAKTKDPPKKDESETQKQLKTKPATKRKMKAKTKDPPEKDENEKRRQVPRTRTTATRRKMTVKLKDPPEKDSSETQKQPRKTKAATKRKRAVETKDPPDLDEEDSKVPKRRITLTGNSRKRSKHTQKRASKLFQNIMNPENHTGNETPTSVKEGQDAKGKENSPKRTLGSHIGGSNVDEISLSSDSESEQRKPPTVDEATASAASDHDASSTESIKDDAAEVTATKRRNERKTWSKEDDARLLEILSGKDIAHVKWPEISKELDNGKNGKQCRDRWLNYLRPGIKKRQWSKDEEDMIRDMHKLLGPKWTAMAQILHDRTDNDIKNKWYSMCRREAKHAAAKSSRPHAKRATGPGKSPTVATQKPESEQGQPPAVDEATASAPSDNGTTIEPIKDDAAEVTALNRRNQRKLWSKEDDTRLVEILSGKDIKYVQWPEISKELDNGKTGKQCRDRWLNYLRPGIKKREWSRHEEEMIQDMHNLLGPKWTAMAQILDDRTDNDIKNKWHSMCRREANYAAGKSSRPPAKRATVAGQAPTVATKNPKIK